MEQQLLAPAVKAVIQDDDADTQLREDLTDVNTIQKSASTTTSQIPIIRDFVSSFSKIEDLFTRTTPKSDDFNDQKSYEAVNIIQEGLQKLLSLQQRATDHTVSILRQQIQSLNIENQRKQQQIKDLEDKVAALEKQQSEKQAELSQLDTKAKIAEKRVNNKDIELGLIYHKLKKTQTDLQDKTNKLQSLVVSEDDTGEVTIIIVCDDSGEQAQRIRNEKALLIEEKVSVAENLIEELLKSRDANPFNQTIVKSSNSFVKPKTPYSPIREALGVANAGNPTSSQLTSKMTPKEEIEYVIKETRLNKIRDVTFSNNLEISREQLESFAAVLKLNTTIQKLDLNGSKIGDSGLKILLEAIKDHQNLKELNLQRCGLTIAGVETLFNNLEKNHVLHTLNISQNFIEDAAGSQNWAKLLAKFIEKNNPSLHKLCVANTQLGPRSLEIVGPALARNNHLTSFDISGNPILASGAEFLFKGLKENDKVESLSLWGCMIGADGAKHLADWLKKNKSVKKLNLKGNNLREEGLRHIATAILENPQCIVSLLEISGNAIGPEGAKQVARLISEYKGLIEVFCGGNNLGDDGVASIAKALPGNTTLKILNLELNLIANAGAKAIAKSISETKTLVLDTVDLSFNRVGVDGAVALRQAIDGTRISTFKFDGNGLTEVKDLTKMTLDEAASQSERAEGGAAPLERQTSASGAKEAPVPSSNVTPVTQRPKSHTMNQKFATVRGFGKTISFASLADGLKPMSSPAAKPAIPNFNHPPDQGTTSNIDS